VRLRLPGQGNQELIALSATSKGYRKLHFEFESRAFEKKKRERIKIIFCLIEGSLKI